MASKSAQQEVEKAEMIEGLLDHLDTTLDRVKVLYEQFFLGIQKQPPTHLHTDVERKLRDLQQMQIRNTALRYRFATLQQKFGSYNNYWRRTLRQIENGTYHRNLAKIGRQAALSGEDIPEEILAAMPKRMREQVKRDREAALSRARRREQTVEEGDEFADEEGALGTNPVVTRGGAHVIDDDGFDVDAYFSSITNEDATRPDVHAVAASSSGRMPAATSSTSMRSRDFEGEGATDDDFADPPAPPPPAPGPAASRPGSHQQPPSVPSMPAPSAQPSLPQAPSQVSRPLPVMPGALRERAPVAVETLSGPFARDRPGDPSTQHATGSIPTQPASGSIPTQATPAAPPQRATTQPAPSAPLGAQRAPASGAPTPQAQRATGPVPTQAQRATGPVPTPQAQRATGPIHTPAPTEQATGSIPTPQAQRATGPVPTQATQRAIGPLPTQAPSQRATGPIATHAPQRATGPIATPPTGGAPQRATGPIPTPPTGGAPQRATGPIPTQATGPAPQTHVPQNPNARTAPGMGPARPAPPGARPAQPPPPQRTQPVRVSTEPGVAPPKAGPPPGMTDADVNALYATYVKAKEAIGEKAGPGSYGKLLQTINAQAPKIMEQYKAKGVDFQVVVKDNQVVIRAKPKP